MDPFLYLEELKEIYGDHPPEQGKIGHRPATYIFAALAEHCADKKLKKALVELLKPHRKWPFNLAFRKLNRAEVGRICRHPSVDPLVAYCYAMAWGIQWSGSGFDFFAESISEPKKLRRNLSMLRNPEKLGGGAYSPRQKAFQLFSETSKIGGLGISYYTKLIFFFLPRELIGYVLDNRTALAVSKLPWPPSIIGKPKSGLQNTNNWKTPENYEAYCRFIELLAREMGVEWSANQAEQALFGSPDEDEPGWKWRELLKP